MESPQVKVQNGILQGKKCKTFYGKMYYSFEGIPYAKPPVGPLRFRNPEPPISWEGVKDATKPGNKCVQSNPYSLTPIDGSEDCLYLNVYTPMLPVEKQQKLPVIFFIHGGRLLLGYGNYYTPDYLIKHDVIIITINYRLNIFGWLCLNLPECPGNAGLKDAAMALKWVNKNIGYFNGDANNITVFGESAGGAIATSFVTSKMTEGLYSKVIAQSGNCIADLYLIVEDPIKKARQIASILGRNLTVEREIYDFLIQVPSEDLIMAAVEAELSRPRSVLNAFFLPVVEKQFDNIDAFFTEHPRVSIRENRFHKVPMLTTTNSHEAAIFFNENGNVIYEKDLYYFIPQYAFVDRGTRKAEILQRKIHEFYMKSQEIGDNCKEGFLQMVSDVFFWRDIIMFAERVSQYWDNIYVLQFNYCGNMNTRIMPSLKIKGATHGDMIQYQFYREGKAAKATKRDWEIVEFLAEVTSNFAKTGKPTLPNQKQKWLPYTKDKKCTLVIDDDIKLVENLGLNRVHFWNELAKDYTNFAAKL